MSELLSYIASHPFFRPWWQFQIPAVFRYCRLHISHGHDEHRRCIYRA